MRRVNQPIVELAGRRCSDRLEPLLADGRVSKVRCVFRPVLLGVAEQRLSNDRSQGRFFLAADACLQLVVLDVGIDGGGPSEHERERA